MKSMESVGDVYQIKGKAGKFSDYTIGGRGAGRCDGGSGCQSKFSDYGAIGTSRFE